VILLSECSHMNIAQPCGVKLLLECNFRLLWYLPLYCEMLSEIIKPILIQFTIVQPYFTMWLVIDAPFQHTLLLNSTSLHSTLQFPLFK
jgi:hypothetical protein